MDIIDNYLVTLPTFITQTINQKCQLLNPGTTLDIFTSRESLDHLSPAKLCLYFTIYLKDKDLKKNNKTVVEQVKLEIHNESSENPKKEEEMNIKGIHTKMYMIKKSINSFLVSSPLFSYLIQNRFPEVHSSHFEASCGPIQEANCQYFEKKNLNNINIEGYKVSLELTTYPSNRVVDFVDEYRVCSEAESRWPSQILEALRTSKDEWDIMEVPDGYCIDTQKKEANKSKICNVDSGKGQEAENDDVIVEQKYISIPMKRGGGGKERFMSEGGPGENVGNKEGTIEDVKQLLEEILMNARELKKLAEKTSWNSDTIQEVLLNETQVYHSLKNV